MKIGRKGVMKSNFDENYDQEDDVYYVTFKTGEPSYCVEVDDVLLLEVGIFSNLPTGFRILNFQRSKVGSIKINVLMEKVKDKLTKQPRPTVQERRAVVEEGLHRVLRA